MSLYLERAEDEKESYHIPRALTCGLSFWDVDSSETLLGVDSCSIQGKGGAFAFATVVSIAAANANASPLPNLTSLNPKRFV